MVTTILGLMPFQIMWVYLGTTLRSLTDVVTGNVEDGSMIQYLSLVLQFIAAIVLPLYLCYRAARKPPPEPAVPVDV